MTTRLSSPLACRSPKDANNRTLELSARLDEIENVRRGRAAVVGQHRGTKRLQFFVDGRTETLKSLRMGFPMNSQVSLHCAFFIPSPPLAFARSKGRAPLQRLRSATPGVYKEGLALRCCGDRNGRIRIYGQVCGFQAGGERRPGPHVDAVPARKSLRETCQNSARRKIIRSLQTPVWAWRFPNRIYLAAMPKRLA